VSYCQHEEEASLCVQCAFTVEVARLRNDLAQERAKREAAEHSAHVANENELRSLLKVANAIARAEAAEANLARVTAERDAMRRCVVTALDALEPATYDPKLESVPVMHAHVIEQLRAALAKKGTL
jgi:hypothetical protein